MKSLKISIHALLAESDSIGPLIFSVQPHFYPRSPCGERPITNTTKSKKQNFYPRSPCGERRSECPHTRQRDVISIHALLAESDFRKSCEGISYFIFLSTLSLRRATGGGISHLIPSNDFYPRSPCGERQSIFKNNILSSIFLSTLSLRRATPLQRSLSAQGRNFYPRSPCGERRIRHISQTRSKHFYPRSPCGERQRAEIHANSQQEFLSTLSLRRATIV